MKSLHLARPHAIMMVGLPGSGKTFFAEKFASTFNAPFINTLDIEQGTRDSKAAGALISLFVNEIAKTGHTFVFEGSTDSRVRRTEFVRWARSKGYQPLLVWVQVDPTTARMRTIKSKRLTAEEFDATLKSFSSPHSQETPVVISGKHTYASQAKVVLNHLASERRPNVQNTSTSTPTSRPSSVRTISVR